VRPLRQPVAGAGQLGVHGHLVLEVAGVAQRQRAEHQREGHDHGDARHGELARGGAAAAGIENHLFPYPEIRKPGSMPQMASVRNSFAMTITTMTILMACPAATPTPSGPPVAT